MLQRFGITHREYAQQTRSFYTPCYRGQAEAEAQWTAQRLALPIPVDPDGVGGR